MKVGYIRVSTSDQNLARQEALMEEHGIKKVFPETVSGKSKERPELDKLMEFVREGDVVVVESISRFTRNGVQDFLKLHDQLKEKGVGFISLKENWDTTTPQGKFMLTIFAALYELEIDTTRERQLEGIAIAKAAGKYKGRQANPINWDEFGRLHRQWKRGETQPKYIYQRMGLTRPTFYRRLYEYEKELGLRGEDNKVIDKQMEAYVERVKKSDK